MSDLHLRALADAALRCFWLDSPRRPPATAPLEGDADTDLAVVGGGFTGLWTALLARERDPLRDVVVLEATRVAEGASGRNGGFVDASLTHGLENGLHHFPDEMGRLHALGVENLAELVATLARFGIDAGYEPTGKLEVATAAHLEAELEEHRQACVRFGVPVDWLDRDALRAEIASPTYHAGVDAHIGGIVDPARLCWGLAAAATAHGARLYEGSPVVSLRRSGAGVVLRTPRGRLRARRAVVATNAYRNPLRRLRWSAIPVWDYVLVTEPLSEEMRRAIGWRRRQGIGDVTNQFHYYRLTADDRILWGGYDAIYGYGSSTAPAWEQRRDSYELLARHFFETFPQLAGLRFTHRWAGPIATTTRFCMDAGRTRSGRVAWALGYTGLGIAASRFGARVALDLVERPDAEHLANSLVRRRPIPWPPEPLRWAVVQLTRHELARADRNQGRRGAWLRLLDRLRLGFDS
jgi:glycine/D-amino acid oxidase-like deaminating enzyme